jgi:hypothetical protein
VATKIVLKVCFLERDFERDHLAEKWGFIFCIFDLKNNILP